MDNSTVLPPSYQNKDTASSRSNNTLPPPDYEERVTTSSKPSPLPLRGCTWTHEQIAHRNLISHRLTLLFAIPTLALFATDLHAYTSQMHPTLYSTTHPTRYYHSNPIEIVDGLALAFLSIAILYSTAYVVSLLKSRPLLDPATIYRHIILIALSDWVLYAGILGVSNTALSMRISISNCQTLLYLDEGACDSYRININQAAGALGIITVVAIHIRWAMSLRLCFDRWRHSRSHRTGNV